MSFSRHGEIFPSDGAPTLGSNAPAHRLDESPVGYSLTGWSPPLPGRCEKIAVHSEAGRMVQEPVRFGVFCFGQKIATVAGDRDNNIAF